MTERDWASPGILSPETEVEGLARSLEQDLLQRYGPMIGQDDLRQALGYASLAAFRQAYCRGQVPVPVFAISHRRGKYALVKDLALWLASMRLAVGDADRPTEEKQP